jgi:DNA polymerase-1
VHPRWSVNKITGRWGSEAPQVQNWPKADVAKNRPNLRAQVVAPPGRKLVGADFSALEARVIALISGDPFLCGVFQHPPDVYGPGDIHSQFARVLWSDYDAMEKGLRKKTRDIIKRVVYGSLYGADATTLHAAVSKDYPEISLGQVRKMNEIMKSKIPLVDRYYANLTRQVMQTGELRSFLLGRRRTFPTGNADPNELRNFGVQAAGADIADTGVVRLYTALPAVDPSAMLILQIHDAIVVECDENLAEPVRDCVISSLTQTHENNGLKVLFPVECNVGDNWSEV